MLVVPIKKCDFAIIETIFNHVKMCKIMCYLDFISINILVYPLHKLNINFIYLKFITNNFYISFLRKKTTHHFIFFFLFICFVFTILFISHPDSNLQHATFSISATSKASLPFRFFSFKSPSPVFISSGIGGGVQVEIGLG